ncbi:MAG: YfhO family protein [Gracilibacteraceae bacterium]|nr:YfhO family protein [Gracilibacteraceae bacterium]
MTDNLNKLNQAPRKLAVYGGAFFLPALTLLLVYAVFGVYPFGEKTILVLDMNAVYVDYYQFLRGIALEGRSLIYSLGQNLGGETLGLFFTFLASPLNIVILLFPAAMITEAIFTLMLLKVGFCGLAMAFYLQKSEESGRNMTRETTLIFASLYALMGFVVTYGSNLVWLDTLILLPLTVLGTERVIRGRGWRLFAVSFTFTIIVSYYLAYMVAIFLFLYYLYYAVSFGSDRGLTACVIRFARFLGLALLSALCAAAVLLPVLYSLSLGKLAGGEGVETTPFSFDTNFSALDFFPHLLPTVYDTLQTPGLPVVYCGLLPLLLLPLYFLHAGFPAREKLAAAGVLLAIFFSMQIQFVNIIWHGFRAPVWYSYRYTFVFSFFILILAARALPVRPLASPHRLAGILIFWAAVFVLLDKFDYDYIDNMDTFSWSLIFLVAYALMLVAMARPARFLPALLCAVITLELFINGLSMTNAANAEFGYSPRARYYQKMEESRGLAAELRNRDEGLYRVGNKMSRTAGDSMVVGINGVTGHNYQAAPHRLLRGLGFVSIGYLSYYFGQTPLTDALLGVKYVVRPQAESADSGNSGGDLDTSVLNLGSNEYMANEYRYELLFSQGDYAVYENPYALPLAFPAAQAALTLPLRRDEPFVFQNETLGALLGRTGAYFSPLPKGEPVYTGLRRGLDFMKGHRHFLLTAGEEHHIQYTLTGRGDEHIYMYIPTDYVKDIMISLDGQVYATYTIYAMPLPLIQSSVRILDLGTRPLGEEFTVRINMMDMGMPEIAEEGFYIKEPQFYSFDLAAFEADIALLGRDVTARQESDTELTFQVTAGEDQILFTTIPYEPGWRVYVDGARAAAAPAIETFLAVPLSPGAHEVRLEFRPWQIPAGAALSAAGLAIFAAMLLIAARRRWGVGPAA